MQAIKPISFPLTKQADRVALLVGITAGTVTRPEVEAAVLHDTAKRPYRKPVVVEHMRFDSVTEAAHYLTARPHFVFSSKNPVTYAKRLDAYKHQIARYCNADNVDGYYWSE